jgi:hypothetical protein
VLLAAWSEVFAAVAAARVLADAGLKPQLLWHVVKGDPPRRGRFLVKVGGRPGVPVKVVLTGAELAVTSTNRKWSHQ